MVNQKVYHRKLKFYLRTEQRAEYNSKVLKCPIRIRADQSQTDKSPRWTTQVVDAAFVLTKSSEGTLVDSIERKHHISSSVEFDDINKKWKSDFY